MLDEITTLFLFISASSLHIPLFFLRRRQNIFLANLAIFFSITFQRLIQLVPGYIFISEKDYVSYFACFSVSLTYLIEASVFYLILNTSLVRRVFFKKNNLLDTKYVVNKNFVLLLISFLLLSIFVLIISSNGNFLFNPREFYQNYRKGFGPIFSLYVSLLGIIQPIIIFAISEKKFINRNKNYIQLLTLGILFLILASLSGSKFVILSIVGQFIAMVYLFNREAFKKTWIFILPFGLFLILFNFYSTIANITNLEKLQLYVGGSWQFNRAMFEQILNNNFDYFNGQITFTKIYGLLPRMIFPEKPIVFGQSLLIERFLPGAVESGHTPSFGDGAYTVADFGVPLGNIVGAIDFKSLVYFLSVTCLTYRVSYLSKVGLFFAIGIGFYNAFSFHIPISLSILFYCFIPVLIFKTVKAKIKK